MDKGRRYFRIMLGRQHIHADECYEGEFFGGDWNLDLDLTDQFPENWRVFNEKFRPVYLEKNPGKTKVAAGLACGMLYTICKGITKGDIVLCPNGKGNYYVGEVVGGYYYVAGEKLPHRRKVQWKNKMITRSEMSQRLQRSTGSIGTVSEVSGYAEEIEKLFSGPTPSTIVATDDSIEDPFAFALEDHLEEFLVNNWDKTLFGKRYRIYEEDGEVAGKQYPSDTGPIDILAISKNKKELLVVELKRGRASDSVVGQIQRYMGYVMDELAEEGQKVRGAIVALEDDKRLRRALRATNNIDFYRYKVSFKLIGQSI